MTQNPENTLSTGSGIGLTFLYYFSMTAVIVVLMGSCSSHFAFTSPQLHLYGVVAGLIAGLVGVFVNRSVTMDISFEDPDQFRQRLTQKLAELGFEQELDDLDIEDNPATEEETIYLTYLRSGLSGWMAGGIYVIVSDHSAKISSRARRCCIKRRYG
ncbi:MAG: hypothetical protein HC851_13620 [Acaryochloris sp. RU_4_1]|nr:hypothetical protein [Acaryochloris sp. RU_4_1]NJR55365.1 hypothetical protein [Acaryochloris sp. CRU_2_0]